MEIKFDKLHGLYIEVAFLLLDQIYGKSLILMIWSIHTNKLHCTPILAVFSALVLFVLELGKISDYYSTVIGGQMEVKYSLPPQGSELWFYFQDTEHKPSLFHV